MNINSTTNTNNYIYYTNHSTRTKSTSTTEKVNATDKSIPSCAAKNESLKNTVTASDGTTFPTPYFVVCAYKYVKVVDEHYEKENEKNKCFPNPAQHIKDKYYNKNSPYYIKDLTEKERTLCYNQETYVLGGGHACISPYDPVIQKTFGHEASEVLWNEEVRNDLNNTINQLFEENGIVIPEDTDLKLLADPFKFEIHASGVDDALAKKIEQVLNQGKNGLFLYMHIKSCNPEKNGFDTPRQYMADVAYQDRAFLWTVVNDLTGYDMRELECKDGILYTPEGRNLWEIVKENYEKKTAEGTMEDISIWTIFDEYQRFIGYGWDMETEIGLAIGYKNGSLYDLDTEYGYGPGQTQWLNNKKEQMQKEWENYQRERKIEIESQSSVSTPSTISFEEEEQRSNRERLAELLQSYQKSVSILNPVEMDEKFRKEVSEILTKMLRDGSAKPLTDVVIELHQNKTAGFDAKA